jgi:hypothetical protein
MPCIASAWVQPSAEQAGVYPLGQAAVLLALEEVLDVLEEVLDALEAEEVLLEEEEIGEPVQPGSLELFMQQIFHCA